MTRSLPGIAAMLMALPAVGQAPTDDTPLFSWAAFGTLGVVHSSENQADFARNTLIPRGAGASAEWASNVDSMVAAQLTAALTPKFSAVVQALSEYNYDNTFRPHLEWANLRYAVTPGLALRVGRIAVPVFMHTDTRRLGFALPWVRTPTEVYELIPFTSNDGIDLIWQQALGRGVNTLQVAFGESETRFRDAAGANQALVTRDQFVATDSFEIGALTLRLAYGQAHLTVAAAQPLFDAYRQFGPAGNAVADRFEARGRLARFHGTSAVWDPGSWFLMAEWGHLDTHNIGGRRHGWYTSAGRRLGKFTPYATYAKSDVDTPTSGQGLDLAQLAPEFVPLASELNAILNAELNSVSRQDTWSLGLRWEALRGLAIKVQYDYIDLAPDSFGTFNFRQPGYVPGGTAELFSVTFDFVL
jgi:hypothetical protein